MNTLEKIYYQKDAVHRIEVYFTKAKEKWAKKHNFGWRIACTQQQRNHATSKHPLLSDRPLLHSIEKALKLGQAKYDLNLLIDIIKNINELDSTVKF